MATLLTATGIELTYDDRKLHARPLDFTLESGKITVLIGPNGAGKTTLLRALLKDVAFRQGNVIIGGQKLAALNVRELSELIGFVFVSQDQAHFSDHRVFETLATAFYRRLGLFGQLSAEEEEQIKRSSRAFALESYLDRPLARLSQGERQRVFLLRALLQRPKLLLLDEPTNHLDPGATALFWEELSRIKQSAPEMAVLASTHDLNWARSCADNVLALNRDGIFYQGENSKTNWDELTRELYCLRTTS